MTSCPESTDDIFPTPDKLSASTTTHTQGPFRISSRKLPISKSGPISEMEDSLKIPVPEMIFGDNMVSIEHVPSGWRIEFNTYDALDAVDKTEKNMLQVSYARSWSSSRETSTADVKEVVKPFDWSYSTTYSGTMDERSAGMMKEGQELMPFDLLKKRDPILFFDEVVLYESELDDNGISLYSVKVRVHEKRMLLLARLFMRLDNVLVRVRDTRVYVDFEREKVIREYIVKQGAFEDVKRALYMLGKLPDDITVSFRDSNIIASILKPIDGKLDQVNLKASATQP